MKAGIAGCVSAIVVAVMTGCASSTSIPVQERSHSKHVRAAPSVKTGSEYIVRKGDTLYSIAFRHGLNYRTLARNNSIGSDFQIYPGQRLLLKPSSKKIVREVSTASSGTSKKTSTSNQKTLKKQVKKPPNPPKKELDKRKAPVKQARVSNKTAGAIRWQWPSNGKVIAYFRTKGKVNKGLNLAGRTGDPVYAAAGGQVVYAGSGLLGYGNLIIIDHNSKFLSAYAHNSRMLVKESDKVSGGEKIAEMGHSGAERVMLHFEIRRDGVPVNPLKYLPKKQ